MGTENNTSVSFFPYGPVDCVFVSSCMAAAILDWVELRTRSSFADPRQASGGPVGLVLQSACTTKA